jgi:hypothetical protein
MKANPYIVTGKDLLPYEPSTASSANLFLFAATVLWLLVSSSPVHAFSAVRGKSDGPVDNQDSTSSKKQSSPQGTSIAPKSDDMLPRIRLSVGSTTQMAVDFPIITVIALDPDIVSAEAVEERQVKFTGRAAGETVVIVSARAKRLMFVVQVTNRSTRAEHRSDKAVEHEVTATASGSYTLTFAPGLGDSPAILRQRFNYSQQMDKGRTLFLGADTFKFFRDSRQLISIDEIGLGIDRLFLGVSGPEGRLDFLDSDLRISPLSFKGYVMRGFHFASTPQSRFRGAELFAGIARPSPLLFEVSEGLLAGGVLPVAYGDNWQLRASSFIVAPRNERGSEERGVTTGLDGKYALNDRTNLEGEVALANGAISWRGRFDASFGTLGFMGEVVDLDQRSPLVSIGAQSAGYRYALASLQWRPLDRLTTSVRYFRTEPKLYHNRYRAILSNETLLTSVTYGISRGSRISLRFLDQNLETSALSLQRFQINTRNFILSHSMRIGKTLSNSFEGRITSSREVNTRAEMEYGLNLREELRFASNQWYVSGYATYNLNTPSILGFIMKNPSLLPPLLRDAFEADPVRFVQINRDILPSLLPGVLLPETRSMEVGLRFQSRFSRFTIAGDVRSGQGEIMSQQHRDLTVVSSADIRLDDANSIQITGSRFYTFDNTINSTIAISYIHNFGNGVKGFQFASLLGLNRSQIEGRIFFDENGNGREDEGEPGVSGMKVRMDNDVIATTDTNGNFNFTASEPGKYSIALASDGLGVEFRATTEAEQIVRLSVRQKASVRFGITNFGHASGRVFNDLFLNGGQKAESAPGIGGVRILLLGKDKSWKVITNLAGEYTFPALIPGDYRLEIDPETLPPDFNVPQQTSWLVSVKPLKGSYLDIPVTAQRAISGVVFIDNNGDGAYNEQHDRPIKGARVKAGESETMTDQSGKYLLRNLPAGKIELTASIRGASQPRLVKIEFGPQPAILNNINIALTPEW